MKHAEGLRRRSFALAAGLDGCERDGMCRERPRGTSGLEMRAMAVEFPVVQIQTTLLGAGVLTVNEVRAMRGLGPLGDLSGGPGGEAVTQ